MSFSMSPSKDARLEGVATTVLNESLIDKGIVEELLKRPIEGRERNKAEPGSTNSLNSSIRLLRDYFSAFRSLLEVLL
jgi:hypothetical protein